MDQKTFDKRTQDTLKAFKGSFGWKPRDLAQGLKKAGRTLPRSARRAGAQILAAQEEMDARAEEVVENTRAEPVVMRRTQSERVGKPEPEEQATPSPDKVEAEAEPDGKPQSEEGQGTDPVVLAEPAPEAQAVAVDDGSTATDPPHDVAPLEDTVTSEPSDAVDKEVKDQANVTSDASDAAADDDLDAQREKAERSFKEPVEAEPIKEEAPVVDPKRAKKLAKKETRRLNRAFDRLQDGIASVDMKELRARRRVGALASAAFNMLLVFALFLIVLRWRGLM